QTNLFNQQLVDLSSCRYLYPQFLSIFALAFNLCSITNQKLHVEFPIRPSPVTSRTSNSHNNIATIVSILTS
ncbi:hypothetical protein M758_9G152000, partial [Ceratodon purpureus]